MNSEHEESEDYRNFLGVVALWRPLNLELALYILTKALSFAHCMIEPLFLQKRVAVAPFFESSLRKHVDRVRIFDCQNLKDYCDAQLPNPRYIGSFLSLTCAFTIKSARCLVV